MNDRSAQLPFHICVTLTEDDYVAANIVMYSTGRMAKRRLKSVAGALVIGALVGWYWWQTHDNVATPWPGVIGFAVAGAALTFAIQTLFVPMILRRVMRRAVASLKKRGPIPYLGQQQVTFDERGVTGESSSSSIRLNWWTLTARVDDAERLYLLSGGTAFVVLPRRDLSPDELADIDDIVSRYMPSTISVTNR
ncbi:YcxB family protein [Paraburkholderia phenazinium]|jgi:hypothetical protein|uniref:YcxB-like protein n=1 Tax=Paraburkholderia phenazinium TaxID=60549 RepID=A0A1G8HFK7_9BURK|nr:YcxB family protein [Paraburkholderia phenazinium]SDI05436.1 hypothetical protein SAMN05216466_116131 [Paraburkholderia phenazinium]